MFASDAVSPRTLVHGPGWPMQAAQVSGLGLASAAGVGTQATLETFASGRVAAAPPTLFESALQAPVFEVALAFEPAPPPGRMRTVDLAFLAVDQALRAASLEPPLHGLRVGVCLGTTVGSQLNDIEFYTELRERGTAPMAAVHRYLRSNLAQVVAERIGATGPRVTVVNACSSGADAVGVGLSWLRAGLCDIVVAGGADELSRVTLAGFHALGVVSSAACRPFDAARDGLNLGEGAGVLVLETLASARARRQERPIAAAGYGTRADAFHLTAPRPDGSGLEGAIRTALAEAGIGVDEVDFVNAHGTATAADDVVEAATLARVFGPDVRFVSTKSQTGHTLGAAGGLEAAFTVLALEQRWVPGSVGFRDLDPAIPVGPIRHRTAVERAIAVSTSLAFGGNNSALVFRDLSRVGGGGA